MARGRNGASKKPETSSSMDKGRAREFMLELARVFPSQKEKTGFNCRHFLSRYDFVGALYPCRAQAPIAPLLNATGRLFLKRIGSL